MGWACCQQLKPRTFPLRFHANPRRKIVLLPLCFQKSKRSLCGQCEWREFEQLQQREAEFDKSVDWEKLKEHETWKLGLMLLLHHWEMRRKRTGPQELQQIHQQALWICFKCVTSLFWGRLGNMPTAPCPCKSPEEYYSSFFKYCAAVFMLSP